MILRPLPSLALLAVILTMAIPITTGATEGTPDASPAGGNNLACPDQNIAEQASNRFFDIAVTNVHAANIGCIAYYEITVGVGDGSHYAPDQEVLRWQMALFMVRLASRVGIDISNQKSQYFADISTKSTKTQTAINTITELGIMTGTTPTLFSPDRKVTRADMALYLIRLLEYATDRRSLVNVTIDKNSNEVILTRPNGTSIPIDDYFTDINQLPNLLQTNAINAMYELGIAAGQLDGLYGPNNTVTRAQMASFIIRTLGHTNVRPTGPIVLEKPNLVTMNITTGWFHSCGIRTDKTLECWGDNEHGQSNPPNRQFIAVNAGGAHSCGIHTDKTLECWGQNEHGQTDTPDGQFTTVTAGFSHSCGVSTDNIVVCWGQNEQGQSDAPSGQFITVTAGFSHSCGVRTDNIVVCWGENEHGQTDTPSGQFTAVDAGGAHTCGISTDKNSRMLGR